MTQTYPDHVADAKTLIDLAHLAFGDRLMMTSAFGLNGVALIDLVYRVCQHRPLVIFVNTGFMFPETLALRNEVVARYDLDLMEVPPPDVAPLPPLAACCQARKVLPMRAVLAGLKPNALLTGRGRFQAITRRNLPWVEWDERPIRVNPLVDWTQEQVEAYIHEHDVPYNPLYDRGYYSIGCEPCTRPVEAGEDVRAGRWDWEGDRRVECGLWNGGCQR